MKKPVLYHGTLPPITNNLFRLGYEGEWANPFKSGVHGTAKECTEKYRGFFYTQPKLVVKARRELAGRDLYCPCLHEHCYSHILFEEANRQADDDFDDLIGDDEDDALDDLI